MLSLCIFRIKKKNSQNIQTYKRRPLCVNILEWQLNFENIDSVEVITKINHIEIKA